MDDFEKIWNIYQPWFIDIVFRHFDEKNRFFRFLLDIMTDIKPYPKFLGQPTVIRTWDLESQFFQKISRIKKNIFLNQDHIVRWSSYIQLKNEQRKNSYWFNHSIFFIDAKNFIFGGTKLEIFLKNWNSKSQVPATVGRPQNFG